MNKEEFDRNVANTTDTEFQAMMDLTATEIGLDYAEALMRQETPTYMYTYVAVPPITAERLTDSVRAIDELGHDGKRSVANFLGYIIESGIKKIIHDMKNDPTRLRRMEELLTRRFTL